MTDDKSKGGRPPAPHDLRRVNVPVRLPVWIADWIDAQPQTAAELIEIALLKTYKLNAEARKRAMEAVKR